MKRSITLLTSTGLGLWLALITASGLAAASTQKNPTLAVQAVPLTDLIQNCNAMKELATTAIGIRYSGAKLADIQGEISRSLPNKEDEDYRKVFRYILGDAFSQVVYKEKSNVNTEQKKFIDKYHFLCSATYKGF